MHEQPDQDALRSGIRDAMPVAFAAVLLGVSFGIAARPVLGPTATIVMSAIVFAGAAQFGATAVLAAGGSAVAALTTGILLNLRFLPMGVAIAPSVHGHPLKRAAVGQAINDAAWALASKGGGRFDPVRMIGATIPQYPAWVGGTVVGVLGGELIGDPEDYGLDAVFPAFFLALLLAEARDPRTRAVALIGAAIALALVPIAPPGVPILAAATAALIGARRP